MPCWELRFVLSVVFYVVNEDPQNCIGSKSCRNQKKTPEIRRLNSDKVLFSFARDRERCDRNGHAGFLRPGVDFATTGSEITGISTSSTKLK